MKKLNLSAIRIDGGTQARVKLDQSVVNEYAQHLQDGDVFPPVTVFFDGTDNWLADGFHRYFAHKSIGALAIEAEIHEGTVRDATLYAFSANGRRGLSLSHEDNRKIIIAMLQDPEWSLWSDAHIAKHVGVSKMTVSRIRRKLESNEETAPKPKKKKYVKDGAEQEMSTGNIGKSSFTPAAEEVASSVLADEKIHELSTLVAQLSEENDMLKDKIAIGQWDASEIEKIDIEEVVTDLRRKLRILEAEYESIKTSRDMYQNRNNELMQTVKSLQKKLKKAGVA